MSILISKLFDGLFSRLCRLFGKFVRLLISGLLAGFISSLSVVGRSFSLWKGFFTKRLFSGKRFFSLLSFFSLKGLFFAGICYLLLAGSELVDAAEEGDLEKVKSLIEMGADVEEEKYDETALMQTSWRDHLAVVKVLISKGAKVNAKNLLSQDIHVNGRDKSGSTALMWAALKGRVKTVKVLLSIGANLYMRNNYGETAYQLTKNKTIKKLLKPKKRK